MKRYQVKLSFKNSNGGRTEQVISGLYRSEDDAINTALDYNEFEDDVRIEEVKEVKEMKKFTVYGEVVLSLSVVVEAENKEEALEKVEKADFTMEEYINNTVGVDCSSYEDDIEDPNLSCCDDIEWNYVDEEC